MNKTVQGGGGGVFVKTNVILWGVCEPALLSVSWVLGVGGSLNPQKKA